MSNQKYKMAQTDMNEEAYGYFIVGLRIAIKDAGYKYEKDFADGIMNPVTLSNNLRGKQQMSDANIRKCLERLNSDVSEVVLKGKQAENSVSTLPHYETTRAAAGDYLNPNDIMPAVASWVAEFQKSKDRLGFWRMAFDMLPTAALIIKNRIVVYQNQKSLALGRVIGGALCDNCAGKFARFDKSDTYNYRHVLCSFLLPFNFLANSRINKPAYEIAALFSLG